MSKGAHLFFLQGLLAVREVECLSGIVFAKFEDQFR